MKKIKLLGLLLTIWCSFGLISNVDAKEITCEYDLSKTKLPYSKLAVHYVTDSQYFDLGNVEEKYSIYYQFDNGDKLGVSSYFSESDNTSLWSTNSKVVSMSMNFIKLSTWTSKECLDRVEIIYNMNKTSFGFTENSNSFQVSLVDKTTNSQYVPLTHNSLKGNLYTVTFSYDSGTSDGYIDKKIQVYENSKISMPSEISSSKDGKRLCWQTSQGTCWDFNSRVTSNLLLRAAYLDNSQGGIGFEDNGKITCGQLNDIPAALPNITRNIVNIIKIIVPILLIVLGMIDFVRATIASDDKEMKESPRRFIRRIIAGVVVFFVIAIIQFVFRAVADGNNSGALDCVSCFISNKNDCK